MCVCAVGMTGWLLVETEYGWLMLNVDLKVFRAPLYTHFCKMAKLLTIFTKI